MSFGSKRYLDDAGIKAWATVPREVLLREMAPDKCLDTRLKAAMVLWSWCGPEASETVVVKNEDGWIVRDSDGKPVPATFKTLMGLLDVPPNMKASISRTAQALVQQGFLRFVARGALVLILKPAQFVASVAGTSGQATWNIGNRVVSTEDLPDDPVARTRAIAFLENLSTSYNERLKQLRTDTHRLLEQAAPDLGILIEKSKKSLREEKRAAAANSSIEEEATPPAPPPLPSPDKNGSADTDPEALAPVPAKAPHPLPPPPNPEPADEALAVAAAIEDLTAVIDPSAGRRMLADCRRVNPAITVAAIRGLIASKAKRAARAETPVGFLLKVVPEDCEGWKPPAAAAPPDPDVCPRCRGKGADPVLVMEACEECGGSGRRAERSSSSSG